jgi:hypothetical protein
MNGFDIFGTGGAVVYSEEIVVPYRRGWVERVSKRSGRERRCLGAFR